MNRFNAANGGSQIDGALRANGLVFLVNSAGVLLSRTAQVNVGGLVASTLDLSNSDFLDRQYIFSGGGFSGGGFSGSMINQGSLNARSGAAGLGANA